LLAVGCGDPVRSAYQGETGLVKVVVQVGIIGAAAQQVGLGVVIDCQDLIPA